MISETMLKDQKKWDRKVEFISITNNILIRIVPDIRLILMSGIRPDIRVHLQDKRPDIQKKLLEQMMQTSIKQTKTFSLFYGKIFYIYYLASIRYPVI